MIRTGSGFSNCAGKHRVLVTGTPFLAIPDASSPRLAAWKAESIIGRADFQQYPTSKANELPGESIDRRVELRASSLRKLGLRTWLIAMPRLFWNQSSATTDRRKIIDRLTLAFPKRSIWLSDLVTTNPTWIHLDRAEDPYATGDLYCGGWALYFFEEGSPLPERPLPGLILEAIQSLPN